MALKAGFIQGHVMAGLEQENQKKTACETAQENLDSLANPCDPKQVEDYKEALRQQARERQMAGIDPDDLKRLEDRVNGLGAKAEDWQQKRGDRDQRTTGSISDIFSEVGITGARIKVITDANFTPTHVDAGVGVGVATSGVLPNGKVELFGVPIGYAYNTDKDVKNAPFQLEDLEDKPNARAAFETKNPEEREKLMLEMREKMGAVQKKYDELSERTTAVVEEANFTNKPELGLKHYDELAKVGKEQEDIELAMKILIAREKKDKSES